MHEVKVVIKDNKKSKKDARVIKINGIKIYVANDKIV